MRFRRNTPEPEKPQLTFEDGFKAAVEQSHRTPAAEGPLKVVIAQTPYGPLLQTGMGRKREPLTGTIKGEPLDGSVTLHRFNRFHFGRRPIQLTSINGVIRITWNTNELRTTIRQVRFYASDPWLVYRMLTHNFRVKRHEKQVTQDSRLFI